MTKEYRDSLDPLTVGDSQTWYNQNTAELRKAMAQIVNPDFVAVNIGANDFAMTGNRFTKTTKRLTPQGWVGKTVYGHINKRGRQVVHRVVHHG